MPWLPVAVFVVVVGGVLAVHAALTYLPAALDRRRLERRLGVSDSYDRRGATSHALVKGDATGLVPALDRLVLGMAPGQWLARLIEQAGSKTAPSTVMLVSVGMAILLALVASVFVAQPWAPFAGGGVGLVAPLVWLRTLRGRRIRRFEAQFPEALDLLSRAIRAGHAFTTAVGMGADELPDPVGTELRRAFDEQNFGLPLKDALNGISERVPLLDVRFFVTAVLIQRETGGNLSEILDNLAHVVRERFKVLRQVRVHTAHGRFTGYVLMALPAGLAVALSVINPDHMATLFNERMGRMMVTATICLQIVGYIWIRKVVKIEV